MRSRMEKAIWIFGMTCRTNTFSTSQTRYIRFPLFRRSYNASMQLWPWDVPTQPPVYVTIQSPHGFPTWAVALISSLAGFTSSLLMEYVKPVIARRRIRRTIKGQLAAEIIRNMHALHRAIELTERASTKSRLNKDATVSYLKDIHEQISRDRYDYYHSSDKDVVYDLDQQGNLEQFYKMAATSLPASFQVSVPNDDRHAVLLIVLRLMAELGRNHMTAHSIPYTPPEKDDVIINDDGSIDLTIR